MHQFVDQRLSAAVVWALLALAICLPVAARASNQTDRSFGRDGVVEVPQTGYLNGAPAILGLANDAKGKMVVAIGGGFAGFNSISGPSGPVAPPSRQRS